MPDLVWGSPTFPLHLSLGADSPATAALSPATAPLAGAGDGVPATRPAGRALAEVLVLGEGRALTGIRADRTAVGDRLRHVEHRTCATDDGEALEIDLRDEQSGLDVTVRFERFDGVDAYRARTTVRNAGSAPVTLQSVSTVTLGGLLALLGDAGTLDVWTARNEWCAESRWTAHALTGRDGLVDINDAARPNVHSETGRGMYSRTGTSTWSSGEHVPVAALTSRDGGALVWQLENSGPWRWELDTQPDPADFLSLALMGPTDLHHSWLKVLAPGESFTTIAASFAFAATSLADAVGQLTAHRRRSHLPFTADAGRPLVFNDYMNTLMGDPTSDKLLPLIDAAADAGAEVFCIDAGWYDDGGDWWPSVGAWEPSTLRFGEIGLAGVLDRIRERGMRPGLWVEPEVIGVRSAKAAELPEECIMRRAGVRIVEHDRYFLDLRSPAARSYLDDVFDRLIGELGARYFKWDYNVTPGTGPDTGAASPGEGLLDHARAHLDWFESLRRRHPDVIFEACSSGAMRMDQAILTRYDLQSTSDQQDYRRYATIAAAAPMAMAGEQAGNWAYPQPGWTLEQTAFTLVNGLAGRLYLSGKLDQVDAAQSALVREATRLYPEVLAHHARSTPLWPLGLPAWDDPVVALGSRDGDTSLVFVWNRDADTETVDLPLPAYAGREATVETVFPATSSPALPAWKTTWDAGAGALRCEFAGAESARVLRVRAV